MFTLFDANPELFAGFGVTTIQPKDDELSRLIHAYESWARIEADAYAFDDIEGGFAAAEALAELAEEIRKICPNWEP